MQPPVGTGVPITAGGRGSSQWPSFGAAAVGRASPAARPWLTWLLRDGSAEDQPPAYSAQELHGALVRLGGRADDCAELVDCVGRLFVAAKRIDKAAWASQQW